MNRTHPGPVPAAELAPSTGRHLARMHRIERCPVVLDAVVLDTRRQPRRGRARVWLLVLGWLAALAAVAGLVWLSVMAVLSLIATLTAAIAWAQSHWLLCLLTAAGLLVLLGGGGAGCGGLHCGGCRGGDR